jgi:hypothetical protein
MADDVRLQSLQLAFNQLGRQVASVLSGMSQLTSLKLPGCSLADCDITSM